MTATRPRWVQAALAAALRQSDVVDTQSLPFGRMSAWKACKSAGMVSLRSRSGKDGCRIWKATGATADWLRRVAVYCPARSKAKTRGLWAKPARGA